MRTLVVGDLHGHIEALRALLDRVKFVRGADCLVTAGDLVDHYPDLPHRNVRSLIEFLLDFPNLVPVLGNHDEWMREFL
jgi:serine/threonine protein phosphatase 1